MIFKLLKVLPWVALGYVLGAQAGRARYEQIAAAAQKVKNSGPVQTGVAKAAEKAPVVADAVKTKAASAAHVAADKMPFGESSESGRHVAPDAGVNGTGS